MRKVKRPCFCLGCFCCEARAIYLWLKTKPYVSFDLLMSVNLPTDSYLKAAPHKFLALNLCASDSFWLHSDILCAHSWSCHCPAASGWDSITFFQLGPSNGYIFTSWHIIRKQLAVLSMHRRVNSAKKDKQTLKEARRGEKATEQVNIRLTFSGWRVLREETGCKLETKLWKSSV